MTMEELDRQVVKLLTISSLIVVVVKILMWQQASIWLMLPLIAAWVVSLFRLMSIVPQLPYDYFFDRGYGWSLVYAAYWLLVLLPVPFNNLGLVAVAVVLVAIGWTYAFVRWLRSDPADYALLTYPTADGVDLESPPSDLDLAAEGDVVGAHGAIVDTSLANTEFVDDFSDDSFELDADVGRDDIRADADFKLDDDLKFDDDFKLDDDFKFDDDFKLDDDFKFDDDFKLDDDFKFDDDFKLDDLTFDDDWADGGESTASDHRPGGGK